MPLRSRWLVAVMVTMVVLFFALGLLWKGRQADQQPLWAELQFAQSDWLAKETISEPAELKLLAKAFRLCTEVPGVPPNQEPPMYRLTLTFAEHQSDFWLTHDLRIYSQSLTEELSLSRDGLQLIDSYLSSLQAGQFGELLPWPEVDQLIPRYSQFIVRDLETGLTFRSQRRGGSLHADIQPLAKEDTAILKTIYDHAWSWNRRAVIVEHAGRRIAASINGMPHGAGALANGFPGHHCLHFQGSMTHGGANCDPMHQLMVHYAAGQLHQYLDDLAPDQLQIVALELAGQGNVALTQLIIHNQAQDMATLVDRIRDIRIWSSRVGQAVDGRLAGEYHVSLFFEGNSREYRTTVELTCRYFGAYGKWLLQPDYLEQLIAAGD